MRGLLPLILVVPLLFCQPPWPRFEQYPATETFRGKPAPPILKTPGDRKFRTRIREGAAKGPNFAGHFTIVEWGCGTSCVSIAVVDAKTGEIGKPPFGILGYGYALTFADGKKTEDDDYEPLSYRRNSRLLVIRGCPEDQDCGVEYYRWDGARFILLKKGGAVPLPLQ